MPHFVIAGMENCPHFIHALKVAEYLQENLPDVEVERKEFTRDEWIEFLLRTNKANHWFVSRSPLIWKEINSSSSKPHLIGGLSEFWEYVDDYYGMLTFLSRETINELWYEKKEEIRENNLKNSKEEIRPLILGIFGLNNKFAQILFTKLVDASGPFGGKDIVMKIYDPESLRNESVEKVVIRNLQDLEEDFAFSSIHHIEYMHEMSELVKDTDILLITEDYNQQDTEDRETWLKRCGLEMSELSMEVCDFGNSDLRIICCHLGPVCFTATGLLRNCDADQFHSIVAITAQEGLSAVNVAGKLTGISNDKLGAPPVWGFVGLDEFIDVQGIIVLQDIVRPYKRALKNVEGSTLPQKKVSKELRYLSCNINPKNVENEMIKRCNEYRRKNRHPILPLIRATIHLLECWFAPSKYKDEVISLGIASTDAFGIPSDIIFSQPAFLNEDGFWKPFEDIPILNTSREELKKCVEFTEKLIENLDDYF